MAQETLGRTDELPERLPAARLLRQPLRSRPVRSGHLGQLMRRLVYHTLVGREGWPVTFVAPSEEDLEALGPSPHWYFHIPFCRSICPHCPYFKVPFSPSLAEGYRHAILREFREYRARHDRQPWASIYFGGGTPALALNTVEDVLELCKDGAAPASEIGIELHPRDCSRATL